MPHLLYTVEQLRQIEQAAQKALPPGTLMQRAGEAAANYALHLLAPLSSPKVWILAGPGNNGGDGLEAAIQLAQAGAQVTVTLWGEKRPADSARALERAQSPMITFTTPESVLNLSNLQWDLVVDGLFGIGLARPLTGDLRTTVEKINALKCPILALDIASGLHANTGAIIGPNGVAVQATHTITFIADKPGLHTCEGPDHTGKIQIATLGIDGSLFPQPTVRLNHPKLFASHLRSRKHNTHKGSFGDVVVLGGASGMQGAAILSARAALHSGTGRVFVAFVDTPLAYDPVQPELMCRPADAIEFDQQIVVAGPGGAMGSNMADHLIRAMQSNAPLVLDADALNLLAGDVHLQHMLAQRSDATILTPHPLEAARMLAKSAHDVQSDRLTAARMLAEKFNAIVILKGSGTVIADRNEGFVINPTGNPGLATAGTGDVLAGVCGALLAQKLPAWQAALAAVWLHGDAADTLVKQGTGPIGLTASELIKPIRASINQISS